MSDAQTTANNALQVVQAAGLKIDKIYERAPLSTPAGTYSWDSGKSLTGAKMLLITALTYDTSSENMFFAVVPEYKNIYLNGWSGAGGAWVYRVIKSIDESGFTVGPGHWKVGNSNVTEQPQAVIITGIWKLY